MKDELRSAWHGRREAFFDYEHYLTTQKDWQALHLYRGGRLVEESAALVPAAYRALKDTAVETGVICPLLECHFSTLLPGAVIAPHCDLWNFSINLHLAVDIPDGCSITVAGETRSWEEGTCLLFDYSFEHAARNEGDRPRTCLLVDLWHPETTIPERHALVALITEIRRLMESG
ncbi:aspartyl/asparaginyl beta-hydroxylase domain-containing protein [Streptomyces sp. NPDC048232]|uniref:aspartyl/asparaginyl beta-hydroxylase domain-containing protein n=1 Tax=Streptomyces sp. NPDC048232 TaxID=3365520 RepID=UPI003718F06A